MKKYLVVATVLVALVALFSFGASAADVSLDATASIGTDGNTVTLNSIAVNLADDRANSGYYTVLATINDGDNNIVFAAQETAPISGFNLDPALLTGDLTVKFGGTELTEAAADTATFNFSFVALNADGKALGVKAYGTDTTFTVEGDVSSFWVYGAEIMDATGAANAGVEVSKFENSDDDFAVRSFRTLVAAN